MFNLFKFFLLLGATGFGGPLSLVQLMRENYVEKLKFIKNEEFDQIFTLIKAMPGPVAFQMAVFLGRRFEGLIGGCLAAFGILFPSFMMILAMGFFYDQLSQFEMIKYALDGFLFAVSAIIVMSLKSMVLSSYKNILFWIIILITFYLSWFSFVPEPFLIFGFGIFVVLMQNSIFKNQKMLFSVSFLLVDWSKIFILFKTCLFAGTFVFGTGLAILPVLKTAFVDQLQWLPLQDFTDAVVFGQMTPGPVTITASFLGYRISGLAGALVATIGIFLMPFFHMMTWFPLAVKWLTAQKWIKPFLIGATAAVIGSILMTVVKMNISTYKNFMFWIIFSGTIALLIKRPKTSLIVIIFVSGLFNLIVSFATMHTI
jgi:chromate transporter